MHNQSKHIDRDSEIAIRRFIQLISDRYDIASVIVYGSRARGTHRQDSDADVAVLLNGKRERFSTVMLDMSDTAFDVLMETDINISPLAVWVDEWNRPESYSNPALLDNIAREGVPL
jgi:predicted nucleotidyltransferase